MFQLRRTTCKSWQTCDGQESDPEVDRSGVLREDQEAVHQVEVDRPQGRRQTKHECEVEADGKANQHRQGTRLVRGDATARNFADAAISDGHWKQARGVDVQRHELFVHARASTDICVELCEEDKTEKGDEHRCGQLMQSKCGTGAIAHDWQAELMRTMKDIGFNQGRASLCVFCHRQKDIKTVVQGDDFVSSCERSELEWLCRSLQKKIATKMKMKGEGR